jgi:hypothetical protein
MGMKTVLALVILSGAAALACSSSSSAGRGGSDGGTSADTSTPPPQDSGNPTPEAGGADSSAMDGPASDGTSAGDTWGSYAQGFFQTYCVECHSAADTQGRDYTMYAKVLAEKSVIRCGVCVMQDPTWGCAAFPPAMQFPISDGKNPPNPKPSNAERDRIVAWLTAGAPQ